MTEVNPPDLNMHFNNLSNWCFSCSFVFAKQANGMHMKDCNCIIFAILLALIRFCVYNLYTIVLFI